MRRIKLIVGAAILCAIAILLLLPGQREPVPAISVGALKYSLWAGTGPSLARVKSSSKIVRCRAGAAGGDVTAKFRATVSTADRYDSSSMADSFAATGCAKEAGKNKRKHRRSCRGGGLANCSHSAAAFHAAFTNFSYGLSPKIFYVGLEMRTQ